MHGLSTYIYRKVYKTIPEMRTPALNRTLKLSCPKGVRNRGDIYIYIYYTEIDIITAVSAHLQLTKCLMEPQ